MEVIRYRLGCLWRQREPWDGPELAKDTRATVKARCPDCGLHATTVAPAAPKVPDELPEDVG